MAEEKDDDRSARTENHHVRYEKRDVPFLGVLAVILAAICLGGLQLYFVWIFFQDQQRHEQHLRASRFPLAPPPTLRLPAEPRLEQLDRTAGIETPNVYLREQSREHLLATYGPTDDKGFIHVPIRRAMERVIDELPVRSQSPTNPAKDNGLIDAGEPNSGRLFRGTPR